MTIIHDVQQGSPEWFRVRLGIPTASCADQIVTPVKCELSKSSVRYAYKLLAERLLNTPMESIEGQEWMERGKELEPAAVKQYEWLNEVETAPAGFFTTDDRLVGASPDRLIKGKRAGLEIKCPAPWTHLAYLLDGRNIEYRPQVQCQMLVCEFEYVDFYSYNERMPACTITTPRDEPYIRLLQGALTEFNARLFAMLDRARSLGVFQAFEETGTPIDTEIGEELTKSFGTVEEAGVSGLPPIEKPPEQTKRRQQPKPPAALRLYTPKQPKGIPCSDLPAFFNRLESAVQAAPNGDEVRRLIELNQEALDDNQEPSDPAAREALKTLGAAIERRLRT
jgi:YqaJ-like viral recombinase domain